VFIQNLGIVFIKISKNAKNRDFEANLSCIALDRARFLIFLKSKKGVKSKAPVKAGKEQGV
jgi:hypothetical protein